MQYGDEASPSIIFFHQVILVKMLIPLGPHGIFCSNFAYLCILTFPTAGMRNGDESSPSINLTSQALSVKMLKTLGLHGKF